MLKTPILSPNIPYANGLILLRYRLISDSQLIEWVFHLSFLEDDIVFIYIDLCISILHEMEKLL